MGRISMVLLGLAVLIIAGSAQAGVIVDWEADSWPTDPDVEVQNNPSGFKDVTGNRNLGQGFRLPDDDYEAGETLQLEHIFIRLQNDQSNTGNITIKLLDVEDTNASTLSGTEVFSFDVSTADFDGDTIVDFEITDGPELDPTSGDDGYVFQIIDGGTFHFRWIRDGSDVYDDGGAYIEGGWENKDYSLAITGTVVPEPATMGLLAIGGLGMLLRRRK
ncbi:MAG: PEP-CTERM sorting domain-containing protein [Phycisphaerae bacterium]